jgi:hypothetical protein
MKKLFIFIFLGMFASVFVLANVQASGLTDWTLDGDYYYYNKQIIIDDGLSINLSEQMPGRTIEYSLNQEPWTEITSERIDNNYYLTADVEGYYSGNIALYNIRINADILTTIGVELGNPEILDLRLRVLDSNTVTEPPVDTGGLWHVFDGNRSYVHMRYRGLDPDSIGDPFYLLYETKTEDMFEDTFGDGYGLDFRNHYTYLSGRNFDNRYRSYFPNQENMYAQSISNPFTGVDTTFTIEILYNVAGEERTEGNSNYQKIVVEDPNQVTIEFNMIQDYPSDKAGIYIIVDEYIVYDSFHDSQWDYMLAPRVAMYFSEPEVVDVINPVSQTSWNALPLTNGNPTNPLGDWGEVQDYYFDETSSQISFTVNYLDELYQVNPFTVSADTDFLRDAKKIFYYSDPETNDRILYVNFSDDQSTFLLKNASLEDVTIWKGEALWNLSKNEVHVTQAKTVYNYIPEVGDDGAVYSYFYMPDVPIDNLISVTANLVYQYYDEGFLGIGDPKPREVESIIVTATKGETSSVNPTWVETTYRSMYIGAAITAGVMATGWVPVYGWAVAGAFLLAGAFFETADTYEWFAQDVNQIERVIPGITLTNEINTYIREKSENDSFNPSTDMLYKLHLATLNDGDSVQVLGDLSNVTQVVWETDGEVFVLSEDFIDDPGWGGPGTEPPVTDDGFDFGAWLSEQLQKLVNEQPYVALGVLAVIAVVVASIVASVAKSFSRTFKKMKTPIGFITFVIIMILGVVLIGVI